MKKIIKKVLSRFKKPVKQPVKQKEQVNTSAPLYQYRMNK